MPACRCHQCRLRQYSGGLLLIAAGAILLLGMLRPHWGPGTLLGLFFILVGAWRLVLILVPRDRSHERGPAVFPSLLLLIVGGLILGHHLVPTLPWGAAIALYWPVLLILWGFVRLADHFAGRRRGLSAADVLLLVVIVVAGLAFSGAYRFGQSHLAEHFGVNWPAWNPFLAPHAFHASLHQSLQPATSVLIQAPRGSVRLVPGPAGVFTADISDTVYAANTAMARSEFQHAQPAVVDANGRVLIQPIGNSNDDHISADTVLTLPPTTTVQVALENGQVQAQNWQAPLRVDAGGSVILGHVAGDVDIITRGGDVSCDHISGAVNIGGRGRDVTISEASGAVVVHGAFTGELSFRALPRGVRLRTPQASVQIDSLPGTFSGTLGALTLNGASGITIAASDATLDLNQVHGPLDLRTRNRPVQVAVADLTAPILVSDQNADITLRLPAASAFHLEASARNGRIDAGGFAIPVTFRNRNAAAVGDANASGAAVVPSVHLETSNGTIIVAKNSSETAAR